MISRRLTRALLAALLVAQSVAWPSVAVSGNGLIGVNKAYEGPVNPIDLSEPGTPTVAPVTAALYAVDVASANDVWAVGDRHDTYPSVADSSWYVHWNGSSWTSDTIPGSTATLRGVCAVDASHTWVVGDAGAIRFWDGSSWNAQSAGGFAGTLYDVSFATTQTGWAVGSGRCLLQTSDGGATWSQVASVAPVPGSDLRALSVLPGPRVWAVGDAGVTFLFDGAMWSEVNAGTSRALRDVEFVDADHGWAVGDAMTFRVTTDGGRTWSSQAASLPIGFVPGDLDIDGVSFADVRTGVAISRHYQVIWRTADGGAHWAAMPFPEQIFWIEPAASMYAVAIVPGLSPNPLGRTRMYVVAAYDDWGIPPNMHGYIYRCEWNLTAPTSPGSLLTQANEASMTIGLTWSDLASDETTYVVERAADSTLTSAFSTVQVLPADTVSWTDSVADALHRWYYRVRCENRAGSSGYSAMAPAVLDTHPPTSSSNMDAAWRRSFDVTLTATDDHDPSPGIRYAVDGASEATYGGPRTIDTEGTHDVRYRAIDAVGNAETTRTGQVLIDRTAPVTSSDATAVYVGRAQIHLTPTDGASGVDRTTWWLDGGPPAIGQLVDTSTVGTHTLEFLSADRAGNVETTITRTFRVDPPDNEAPTTTSNIDGLWHRSFEVTFSVTDTGPPGALYTYYTVDAAAVETYPPGPTLSADGIHVVSFWSVDSWGNTETPRYGQVSIDAVSPDTTSDVASSYLGTATVLITATDARSGVERTEWWLDSRPSTIGTVAVIAEPGTFTLHFRSTDRAGNVETTRSALTTVRFDTQPPVTTTNVGPGWYTAPVDVTLEATDDVSGVAATYHRFDAGAPWTQGTTFTVDVEGLTPFSYRSEDVAGNQENPKTAVVHADWSPPHTAIEATANFADIAAIRFTPSDTYSGVARVTSRIDSGPVVEGYVTTTSTVGAHRVAYRAIDVAGNVEETHTFDFRVTRTPLAFDDVYQVVSGETLTVRASGVLGNDVDPDGDPITAHLRSAPASGTLSLDAAGSFTYRPLPAWAGTDTFTYRASDGVTMSLPATVSIRVVKSVTPVAGGDRFATAVVMARKGWDATGTKAWTGVRHIVVASGEDRAIADPLSAAGLCGVYDAPLLLVPGTGIVPSSVKTAITEIASRNHGLSVHVVGGTAAVPAATASAIDRIPYVNTPERVAGADRYATSARIAQRIIALKGAGAVTGSLLICAENPAAYFDALAAGPISYKRAMPMLAVKTGSIPTPVKSVLAALGSKPRYAVSASAYLGASAAGATRLATSTNRYVAATQIANAARTHGWTSPADVGMAAKLPDALGGGAFVGRRGGVLLYTTTTTLMQPTTAAWISANKASIYRGWVFGGTASVPLYQRTQFYNLIK